MIDHFLSYITNANEADVEEAFRVEEIGYPFRHDPEYDHCWYPEILHRHFKTKFPVTVRVHVSRRNVSQLRFDQERQAIEGISQRFRGDFEVIVEERPLAQLIASPGGFVQGTSPGTLGGYITDNSRVYGMTCGHVATVGTMLRDGKGKSLGSIVQASTLTPLPFNQTCNLHTPQHNEIDAAIFPATASLTSGWLPSPPQFGSGQLVSMVGQKSGGPHTYAIGGIALISKVSHNSQDYCFRNLFVIKQQFSKPLPISLQLAMGPVPVQGDSGAWIGTSVPGGKSGWAGMLAAVDSVEGFAVEAQGILNWAAPLLGGKSLSVH